MKKFYAAIAIVGGLAMIYFIIHFMLGVGGFERKFTLSGVYCVKPSGYKIVCCLDSDSKDGGLSCLPLSQVE